VTCLPQNDFTVDTSSPQLLPPPVATTTQQVQLRRPDLRLIISSATLAEQELVAFFSPPPGTRAAATAAAALGAPPHLDPAVISIEGRTFPVEASACFCAACFICAVSSGVPHAWPLVVLCAVRSFLSSGGGPNMPGILLIWASRDAAV
jgi:hypothetical protein